MTQDTVQYLIRRDRDKGTDGEMEREREYCVGSFWTGQP